MSTEGIFFSVAMTTPFVAAKNIHIDAPAKCVDCYVSALASLASRTPSFHRREERVIIIIVRLTSNTQRCFTLLCGTQGMLNLNELARPAEGGE